jgi:tyrosine-protein kinase Etk/Wzc
MNNSASDYPGYDQSFPAADESVDIKRYLSLFVSNWYWFAISLFISVTISYTINRYSEKLFTVSSTMLIKDQQNGGGLSFKETFMPGSDVFKSQQNLKNEMGILKSFNLNLRVIDSLPDFRVIYMGVGKRNIVESNLYTKCPFSVVTDSLNFQPIGTQVFIKIISDTSYTIKIDGEKSEKSFNLGKKFKERGFDFLIKPRGTKKFNYYPSGSNKYYFYFVSPEGLANNYRSKLSVTPIEKDATLVQLSTSGLVPQQEADYLNKLMELYISQGLEAKNQIADSTIKFINRQIKTISDSLIVAEDSLQRFRLQNNLIDMSKEGSILQTRLDQTDNEKITLDLQYQYFNYLQEYLISKNESGDIISPAIMGVTDQVIGRLVQELANLQQQKKQLSMNISGELPPLNLLDENIQIARRALQENVESNLVNLKNTIENVKLRMEGIYSEIRKLPVIERRMIKIQRKFDINNTVYTYLLEKRAETGIARASNVSDNKTIDRADIFNSYQIRPQASKNRLMAFIFGLLFPGLIIGVLYYFNNKILDNSDIGKRTRAPIIGHISHNDYEGELPVSQYPGSVLSESFRSIRTSLKYFIKDVKHPVIAVTSTISAEGKTFISINLASITAMLGKKVLLIGLDLRRPRIHKIFGIDNSEGMSTYLSNNCEYETVISETNVTNLYYATSGPIPPNPAELIEGERMKKFIDRAKKEFDFIIIDTPPLAVVSDTLLLTNLVDVNIFVVRQRYTSKNTLELIEEFYKTEKLKNIGIIINDISLTGYYGYGLRYGYYSSYGYRYGNNYYGKYSYYRYGYTDKDKGYYSQ